MASQEVLVALLTGTVVGISLAAAYFIAQGGSAKKGLAAASEASKETLEKKNTRYGSIEEDEDSDADLDEDPGAEPHKMVIVVNDSLKMGKGKVVAQCCHACLGAYKRAAAKAILVWRSQGQAKIAVKGQDENDLFEVSFGMLIQKADAPTNDLNKKVADKAKKLGLAYYIVADAGRTQVAAGSITACAVGPGPASIIDQVTGKFKLL